MGQTAVIRLVTSQKSEDLIDAETETLSHKLFFGIL